MMNRRASISGQASSRDMAPSAALDPSAHTRSMAPTAPPCGWSHLTRICCPFRNGSPCLPRGPGGYAGTAMEYGKERSAWRASVHTSRLVRLEPWREALVGRAVPSEPLGMGVDGIDRMGWVGKYSVFRLGECSVRKQRRCEELTVRDVGQPPRFRIRG